MLTFWYFLPNALWCARQARSVLFRNYKIHLIKIQNGSVARKCFDISARTTAAVTHLVISYRNAQTAAGLMGTLNCWKYSQNSYLKIDAFDVQPSLIRHLSTIDCPQKLRIFIDLLFNWVIWFFGRISVLDIPSACECRCMFSMFSSLTSKF